MSDRLAAAALPDGSAVGPLSLAGVETLSQAMHLRRLGCDRGQGYLVARPVPADEIEHLVRHDADSPGALPLAT